MMTLKLNLFAIERAEKKMNNIKVNAHIETGDCGMGMPVIRAWQAMKKMSVGHVLQLTSSHP
jgi:hypothetical protein